MSTIIKAGADAAPPRKLRAVDLTDHLAEARQAIEHGRAEAARIVGEARAAAVTIRDDARRAGDARGYEEGLTRGMQEGAQRGLDQASARFATEQAQLVAALHAVLQGIEAQKRDLLIEARHHVLELAFALAGKLTLAIGATHRQAAVENLQRALQLVSGRTDLQVRIHPADEESLRRFAADFSEKRAELRRVTFLIDPGLAAGGCVVTVGGGEDALQVDASLETQLAQIAALLLGDADARHPAPAPIGESSGEDGALVT